MKSFQTFLLKNSEVIFCADDGEYRIYCNFFDELCIERCYKSHLISQTHINNFYKKEKRTIK